MGNSKSSLLLQEENIAEISAETGCKLANVLDSENFGILDFDLDLKCDSLFSFEFVVRVGLGRLETVNLLMDEIGCQYAQNS